MFSFRCLALPLVCAGVVALPPTGAAQLLYDASLGSAPDAQGWGFAANPLAPPPLVVVTNGVLFLDTTPANSTQAGYALTPSPGLDRAQGFALGFTLRLTAESHSGNANRAGFSVIALGSDARGIELGFWSNAIWAQADAPIFTRAEQTNFVTTAGFVDYVLTVGETNYTLFAQGQRILTGAVRDYTPFNGFPDVYETPNFVFFGDNTGSAQGAWGLKQFSLLRPPTLRTPQPNVLAWNSLSNVTFAVETSVDLTTWLPLANVTSPTTDYRYTNSAAWPGGFLRVRFP